MKKTVLLSDTMSFGGSERTVQILANNQNFGNNRLIVVSLANVWEYPINSDVEKHHIYKKNFHALVKLILIPITLIKLIRKLKKIQPEVVISFHQQSHILNVFASKFLKHKTIISERAYIELYYGKKNTFLKPIIRNLYNKANVVLVNDIEIKESLRNFYNIKTKINVINNLLDISNFKKEKATKSNEKIRFITIGRLSAEKNTKDLIIAFNKANIKNSQLEIIGNGPLLETLKSLSKELDVENKVLFHGHKKDIMQFLAKADIFVFTSLNEGFPNVVLEAMFCGLPIISYQFKAGITTILEKGKYGVLIPLNDTTKFSKAMTLLATDVKIREKYGVLSEQRIQYFINKKEYIKKYNDVINNDEE